MKRRALRSGRGYTAVEVMISVALLGIGAAGIISMQRGAIRGSVHARNVDVANAVARTWLERLRADSALWTQPSALAPGINNIAQAKFLRRGAAAVVDIGWFLPDQRAGETPAVSPAFDVRGNDLANCSSGKCLTASPSIDNPPTFFCTHVRVDCLRPTDGFNDSCSLMRATVRVFWPRNLSPSSDENYCAHATAQSGAIENANDSYHFVYATTALRQNAQ